MKTLHAEIMPSRLRAVQRRLAPIFTHIVLPLCGAVLFIMWVTNTSLQMKILTTLFPSAIDHLYDRGTLATMLFEHIVVTAASSIAAILVGVSVGIMVTRKWGAEFLPLMRTISALLQTFPPSSVLVLAVPAVGFGFQPTFIALFIYGLFPIINNTIAGLRSIPHEFIEASRGMGMTNFQIFYRVELPLAARVIVAGIRTSVLINIGTATVGAIIGAGGLGVLIIAGLVRNNTAFLFTGAFTTALLALYVDWGFGLLQKRLFSFRVTSEDQ